MVFKIKQENVFIPTGYIYKKITKKPDWLNVDIEDIYSVSSCISSNFLDDYINYWEHNGYWLFDDPIIMQKIAYEQEVNLSECYLFYYEVYELAFDEESHTDTKWITFEPEASFTTHIIIPTNKILKGFDVVSFCNHIEPECSPLSCNHLASKIRVNKHCLFDTFLEAKEALENGLFKNIEPGPYRIFACYRLDQ